jgi:tellurium resistance protein TerZ
LFPPDFSRKAVIIKHSDDEWSLSVTQIFKRNQEVSLRGLQTSSAILMVGIGWDNKIKKGFFNRLLKKRYDCDLDLSCVTYDHENEKIDTVWYAQLRSKCGGIKHKGDQTTDSEQGDDETMTVDFNQLDDDTKTLFFVVSSFNGNQFAHVEKCYWRLYDPITQREIGRFNFHSQDKASAKIVLRIQKSINEDGLHQWLIKALDETGTGRNIQEILPEIRDLLEG